MAYPYQKIVPFNWASARELPTSFCFCVIEDTKISSQPLVILVLNTADDKNLSTIGRLDNTSGKQRGKPEGFGKPGGGINPEELDTVRGAAEREFLGETGIKIKVDHFPIIEQPQLIISDKRTGERIGRPLAYEKGHEPSVTIDAKNQIALINPIYVFRGKATWDGCKLQNLFHRMKDIQGITDEYTESYGMYILFDEDLTEETMASLEIEEAKIDGETGTREIEGIGIFPLAMLMEMLDTKNCWFEGFYFYYTHLLRIREIAIKLELLPQPVSV